MIGFDMTWDRAGNMLTKLAAHDSYDDQVYTYDSANRLIADTTKDSSNVTWDGIIQSRSPAPGSSMDGLGNNRNIMQFVYGSGWQARNHLDTTFNEYYWINGVVRSHDLNGNLTDDGTLTYDWDAMNRLVKVSDVSGEIVTYLYDANNRRVRKDFPAGSFYSDTDYTYDGWQVIEEREASTGDLDRQFVYGAFIDEPIVMDVDTDRDGYARFGTTYDPSDARYFYHQTTNYSVAGLTAEMTGDLVEAAMVNAYGRRLLFEDGPDGDSTVNFSADDTRTLNGASSIGNPKR